MFEQIKSIIQNDSIYYSAVIVTVAVFSFGLGRWSAVESVSKMPAIVPMVGTERAAVLLPAVVNSGSLPTENIDASAREVVPAKAVYTQLVASKSGTKYHSVSCPGASQIKESNKIYFDTAALARAAGYTPAANCPGLQ
jgi:hypothetical protein